MPTEDPWDEETKAKQSALYFCGHSFAPTIHRCFPIATLTRVGAHPSEHFPARVMFPDPCLIVAVIFPPAITVTVSDLTPESGAEALRDSVLPGSNCCYKTLFPITMSITCGY